MILLFCFDLFFSRKKSVNKCKCRLCMAKLRKNNTNFPLGNTTAFDSVQRCQGLEQLVLILCIHCWQFYSNRFLMTVLCHWWLRPIAMSYQCFSRSLNVLWTNATANHCIMPLSVSMPSLQTFYSKAFWWVFFFTPFLSLHFHKCHVTHY